MTLADLAEEPWIAVQRQPAAAGGSCTSLCREAGFEPRVAFEVDETTAAQALVAADVGVTLLPRLALTAIHPGVVVRKLTDTPVRRVWAARLEGAYPSPASDAMLQTLQDVARGVPRAPTLELAAG